MAPLEELGVQLSRTCWHNLIHQCMRRPFYKFGTHTTMNTYLKALVDLFPFLCTLYICTVFFIWLATEVFISVWMQFHSAVSGSCSLTHCSTWLFLSEASIIASLNCHYSPLPPSYIITGRAYTTVHGGAQWPFNEYRSSLSAASSWFTSSSVLSRFMSASE